MATPSNGYYVQSSDGAMAEQLSHPGVVADKAKRRVFLWQQQGTAAVYSPARTGGWQATTRTIAGARQASEKVRPATGATALPRGGRAQTRRAYADSVRKIVPEHSLPK